jgi:hypothetical protein
VSRMFIFAPAGNPPEAAKRIEESGGAPPDLVIVAPSPEAHAQAAEAVGGRYVPTVEEPLLADVVDGSGDDALTQLAQALRAVRAYSAQRPLVLWGRVDILGASSFVLDEEGLERLSEDLERALPLP